MGFIGETFNSFYDKKTYLSYCHIANSKLALCYMEINMKAVSKWRKKPENLRTIQGGKIFRSRKNESHNYLSGKQITEA